MVDKDFVRADKLAVGDYITTLGDKQVKVIGNQLLAKSNQPKPMFNFEVADYHTYAITDDEIWVHNRCGDDFVDLATPKRRKHILDGDSTGGGHRSGTGKPGKSEFPSDWSDDKIMHEISDIATDPSIVTRPSHRGRTIAEGNRDGVDIRVIQEQGGDIVSGFPTNVTRNPR